MTSSIVAVGAVIIALYMLANAAAVVVSLVLAWWSRRD